MPALLSTLDDKQYQEILANLQKEVAEQQAKRDKSSQEKRLKRLQEETEDWYGPLLTEQIDILKQIRVKQDQRAPYWRAETQAWLAELETLTQLPANARTQAMQKLLLQTLTPSSNRENSTRALWFEIWSLATPTQRDQILEKLSEYHEILLDIQQDT